MILGNEQYLKSPVQSQSYVWIADYFDGTHLTEFDFENRKTNSFYDIDKEKLVKFGLLGKGNQIYFDVANGIFNINRDRIMISYIADGIDYPLTGRSILYNNIIQFKDAVADGHLFTNSTTERRVNSNIMAHAVGYKKEMELAGINIFFQNVFHLPLSDEQENYLQIKISADKDLDGKLVVRVNGMIANEIDAPLKANMSGIINWVL